MIVVKGIDQSSKVRCYSQYHHNVKDLVRAYPDIEETRRYTLWYSDLRISMLDSGL